MRYMDGNRMCDTNNSTKETVGPLEEQQKR